MNRLLYTHHGFFHISHERGIMERLILRMKEGLRIFCRAYPSVPEDLTNDRFGSDIACERSPFVGLRA